MSERSKLRELEKKIAELEGNWKRAHADYLNLERRVEKQKEEIVKFASAHLIQKILPVLDDLERASEHGEEGVRLINENLKKILATEGLEEIKVKVGDVFDPHLMEGLASKKETGQAVVLRIVRRGYKFKDRILRPVLVEVGELKKPEENQNAKDNRN